MGAKRSKSKPVVLPGFLTEEQRAQAGTSLLGQLLGGPPQFPTSLGGLPDLPTISGLPDLPRVGREVALPTGLGQVPTTPFRGALEQQLLRPGSLMPQAGTPEAALIQAVMAQASSELAARGLAGTPLGATQTAFSIAPTLLNLRQQQIQNLMGAAGMDIEAGLAAQRLGLAGRELLGREELQRGQLALAGRQLTGQERLALLQLQERARQGDIDALLQLLQIGGPQVAGQRTTGGGLQTQIQIDPATLALAGAAMFCWIAAALYGYGSEQFLFARYWIFVAWQGRTASIVRRLYLRFGFGLAKRIEKSRLLRGLVKPLFDRAVEKGRVAALKAIRSK